MARPFNRVYSEKVKARLGVLYQEALALGRDEDFLRILGKIDRRLRKDPLSFGESLYNLRNVQIRHGVEDFVVFYWGVHKEQRIVFLTDYKLLTKK